MEISTNAHTPAPFYLLPLYTATLFLGAFLLFWIQPMFAKIILPGLGGSPAVWNTAMMFFQTALLAGYAYAHLVAQTPGGSQALTHVALLIAASIFLPVGMAGGWTPPTDSTPVFWMIGLMTVSIGLPFLAVSATAPLIQSWFAGSGHPHAKDPYFLYVASNLGSMAGLLCYPLVIEPAFNLPDQTGLWSALYLLLTVMIAVTGFSTRFSSAILPEPEQTKAPPVAWMRRLHWLALAFVPSSLLLGVTQHITTDLAAIPLLWVGPLAVYLLTFVLVFSQKPLLRHQWMVRIMPHAMVYLALFFGLISNLPTSIIIGLHVLVFFICAMVCHGELARLRPDVGRLTEFYFWLSFGGMLGGVFNALVAPIVFNGVYEYPLALILACLLYPAIQSGKARAWLMDVALPAGLLAVIYLVMRQGSGFLLKIDGWIILTFIIIVSLTIFSFRTRPLRFALGIAVAMLPSMVFLSPSDIIERSRSFFGVYKIQYERDGKFLALAHGTTFHGAVNTDSARRNEPLTYYSRIGPLGQIHAALESAPHIRNIALVGLGVGTSACYQRPGQNWSFFEIDPEIVRIAKNQRYFHMLADCARNARIVLGDGRLRLAAEPDGAFDLLMLDVFSSDVIPVHLVTREAIALYRDKLSANGILVIHFSNRHLDLSPVLARGASAAGMTGFYQLHKPSDEIIKNEFISPSKWAVMARSEDALRPILQSNPDAWKPLAVSENVLAWSDNYSNLIGILKLW